MRKFGMLCLLAMLLTDTVKAQWTSFTSPMNAGGVFWDNYSNDGQNCNIGYILTGMAGVASPCSHQRPVWLPYTGATPTMQRTGMGFGSLFLPTTATITVLGDIAGADQAWGWYDVVTGIRTNLNGVALNTPVTVGSSVNAWGLFIDFTGELSSGNQFAFFGFASGSGVDMKNFIVGAEDTNIDLVSSDRDYNDLVFLLQSSNDMGIVPEPTTNILMATGLIGVLLLVRRKRLA